MKIARFLTDEAGPRSVAARAGVQTRPRRTPRSSTATRATSRPGRRRRRAPGRARRRRRVRRGRRARRPFVPARPDRHEQRRHGRAGHLRGLALGLGLVQRDLRHQRLPGRVVGMERASGLSVSVPDAALLLRAVISSRAGRRRRGVVGLRVVSPATFSATSGSSRRPWGRREERRFLVVVLVSYQRAGRSRPTTFSPRSCDGSGSATATTSARRPSRPT